MAKLDRTAEEADIALVEELVFSPFGLMLERIAQGGTKTPDGWILKYNQRRALCEIKSPRDDELVERFLRRPERMIQKLTLVGAEVDTDG